MNSEMTPAMDDLVTTLRPDAIFLLKLSASGLALLWPCYVYTMCHRSYITFSSIFSEISEGYGIA
jgi:hypothetical protein